MVERIGHPSHLAAKRTGFRHHLPDELQRRARARTQPHVGVFARRARERHRVLLDGGGDVDASRPRDEAAHAVGTGTALVGVLQALLGAVAAPLAGLGGAQATLPMALTMVLAACVSAAGFAVARAASVG